jgi:phosphatidate cytidylyltransferase
MLLRRFATAFVFIPPFLLGLLTDTPGHLVLACMGAGCSIWGLSEFFNLAGRLGAHPPRRWLYFLAATLPFGIYLRYAAGLDLQWLLVWATVGGIGTLAAIVFSGRVERSWETFMVSIAAMLYIPVPLLLVQVFRLCENGAAFILFTFLTTWLSDTGAFFGGRRFGRHKMSPTISPGKTWEGTVSGAVLAVAGVFCFGTVQNLWTAGESAAGVRFFWTAGDPDDMLRLGLLALVLVGTGVLGDLAESMLKRDLQVKDSGSGLTGHGGFLDITDSLLVNVPLLFIWALLFEGLSLS